MSGRWLIPQPAQEPVAVRCRQPGVLGGRLLGRVHPHVEDPGGDRRAARRPQQVVERREDVAADIGDPQRGVTQALQFRRQLGCPPGIAVAQVAAPDPGPGESRLGHGSSLLPTQRCRRSVRARARVDLVPDGSVAPTFTTVTCSRCEPPMDDNPREAADASVMHCCAGSTTAAPMRRQPACERLIRAGSADGSPLSSAAAARVRRGGRRASQR